MPHEDRNHDRNRVKVRVHGRVQHRARDRDRRNAYRPPEVQPPVDEPPALGQAAAAAPPPYQAAPLVQASPHPPPNALPVQDPALDPAAAGLQNDRFEEVAQWPQENPNPEMEQVLNLTNAQPMVGLQYHLPQANYDLNLGAPHLRPQAQRQPVGALVPLQAAPPANLVVQYPGNNAQRQFGPAGPRPRDLPITRSTKIHSVNELNAHLGNFTTRAVAPLPLPTQATIMSYVNSVHPHLPREHLLHDLQDITLSNRLAGILMASRLRRYIGVSLKTLRETAVAYGQNESVEAIDRRLIILRGELRELREQFHILADGIPERERAQTMRLTNVLAAAWTAETHHRMLH